MPVSIRALTVAIGAGLLIGAALLAHVGTDAAAAARKGHREPTRAPLRARKLSKALKACERAGSKATRRRCDKSAEKHFGPKRRHGVLEDAGYPCLASDEGSCTEEREGLGGAEPSEERGTGGAATAEELAKATTVSETPPASKTTAGHALFEQVCAGCHGATGEGNEGDRFVPFSALPRAQSVTGVIEQLIEPSGLMPDFGGGLSFADKEELGDFICVEITRKCEATA